MDSRTNILLESDVSINLKMVAVVNTETLATCTKLHDVTTQDRVQSKSNFSFSPLSSSYYSFLRHLLPCPSFSLLSSCVPTQPLHRPSLWIRSTKRLHTADMSHAPLPFGDAFILCSSRIAFLLKFSHFAVAVILPSKGQSALW
jgi:hypothetical protein